MAGKPLDYHQPDDEERWEEANRIAYAWIVYGLCGIGMALCVYLAITQRHL